MSWAAVWEYCWNAVAMVCSIYFSAFFMDYRELLRISSSMLRLFFSSSFLLNRLARERVENSWLLVSLLLVVNLDFREAMLRAGSLSMDFLGSR